VPNELNIRAGSDALVGSLSVIVPIVNEKAALLELLNNLSLLAVDQTIIVDGGSTDGSYIWLQENWQNAEAGCLLITSKTGRARQMNAGAALATGDMLLFLHADSRLPYNADQDILSARNQLRLWGRFDVTFDMQGNHSKWFRVAMPVIAACMNLRSRLSSIATGDQAIFVDTDLFRRVGGYPSIPLMEDVALSKILKRHCVPYSSALKITTSARRWQQAGVLRTIMKMWYFRAAYYFGVSPAWLAARYGGIR